MTGTTTQIMIDLADLLAPGAVQDASGVVQRLRNSLVSVLAFAAGLVGTVVTASIYLAFADDSEGIGFIIAGLIGLWAGMGGIAVLASKRKGTGSLAEDFGLWMEGRDLARGFFIGLACNLVLVNAVVVLFQLLGPDVDVGQQSENVTADASGWRLALLAFSVLPLIVIVTQWFRRHVRESYRTVRLWIARINAAVRELGMSYSVFMAGLKRANIDTRFVQVAAT